MFKKFKKKLKGWFKKSEEKVEEKIDETIKEKEVEVPEKFSIGKQKYEPDLEKLQEKIKQKEKKKKKGIIKKVKEKFKFKISEKNFEDIFSDLELIMLENNVALEAIEKIESELKKELIGKEVKKKDLEKEIKESLKKAIEKLLIEPFDIVKKIKKKEEKPFVIVFFGINGSGKTTTIAKVAKKLKKEKLDPVLSASDTFRAASIEQLEKHSKNLGLKVIKGDYGSDPASVAFDAIKHAKSKNKKVVLIDTAGRMYTKKDLLREMGKICKVTKPDLKIFVAESITGNDAIEQAKKFDEAVGIDASILSKADIDDKGGTAISISYITKKPILFLGTGQDYKDLEKFDKNKLIKSLGL